jgi:glycosyltransferase involved in cell wall biosynthesis
MSVVVCAYNAASTLDECLRHTCALDYPGLEIIVVDDGSTDGTAEIARRHGRARLVSIAHAGLAVARNEGFKAASGDLIVYLDADAYPTPEWPHYLALGMDTPTVGGVGGPNVPPVDDPPGAQEVAHAPGGPVHVLLGDDRAEHVPGCNMAFWRLVLEEVGGFDPVYTSAGDDVDLCWKVLDRGWEIGFHPAALVWHHRRAGMRAYLRQQWGYGISEAKVEVRHPDRFTGLGTARWRGRIYNSLTPRLARQRVYRGLYGAAAYQSVYRGGGHALDLAHQAGVPLAAVLLLTAPVALIWHALGLLALAGAFWIGLLAALDWVRTQPPRRAGRSGGWAFRSRVAALHLLQPLARIGGRLLHSPAAVRDLPPGRALPEPVKRVGRGVLLMPADRSRAELATEVITRFRHAGLRVILATGWEDYDARIIGSLFMAGDLVTSAHPTGSVQLRVRRRVRPAPSLALLAAVLALLVIAPPLALLLLAAGAGEHLRGWWRLGRLLNRIARATPIQSERRGVVGERGGPVVGADWRK